MHLKVSPEMWLAHKKSKDECVMTARRANKFDTIYDLTETDLVDCQRDQIRGGEQNSKEK